MCANDQVFWLYLVSQTASSHSFVIRHSGANQNYRRLKAYDCFRLFTFNHWFGFLCRVFATAGFGCVRTLPPQQQALELAARTLARCHQAEHAAVTTHLNRRQTGWKSYLKRDILRRNIPTMHWFTKASVYCLRRCVKVEDIDIIGRRATLEILVSQGSPWKKGLSQASCNRAILMPLSQSWSPTAAAQHCSWAIL